jgi:hypothetical protein
MSRVFDIMLRSAIVLALFFFSLHSSTASAQNIDATLNKVEIFLGYTDKAAPGQLPVTQSEFKQYRALYKHCAGSNDADDVIVCADAFLDSPAGKDLADDTGLPSWTPLVFDIYFDIRNEDFWGLARDVGMIAACIGAQVIAGGTDVCGVLVALIDMAKAAYDSAQKAYEFIKDFGSTVAKAAEAVYCLFSDCSDSGPSPEAVAWSNFWRSQIARTKATVN